MSFIRSVLASAGMVAVGVALYRLLPDDPAIRMGAIVGLAVIMGGFMRRFRIFASRPVEREHGPE
jgi:hypothetical protein